MKVTVRYTVGGGVLAEHPYYNSVLLINRGQLKLAANVHRWEQIPSLNLLPQPLRACAEAVHDKGLTLLPCLLFGLLNDDNTRDIALKILTT